MNDLTDTGIVLAASPHGEHAALVTLFTRSTGLYTGYVPGGQSRKIRGFLQLGTFVNARWRTRIEGRMGTLELEPLPGIPSPLLADRTRLAGTASMLSLVRQFLAERDPFPGLHDATAATLENLLQARTDTMTWAADVARWECLLLAETGFGLDTHRCALTGTREELAWISPHTGRAASRAAGQPWSDRLLPLPPFLLSTTLPSSPGELLQGFRLSGHFLARIETHTASGARSPLPSARTRFLCRLSTELGAV
ncbi:DNA repair protein RecO [Phaeovibrio sulfidiphilus]|uniref:DNA repair protein RecO n=1 Tax=Phaeovibrio sulfidiphilus TaxID=1220600 RepID=A0A8J7CPZ3_9PROT|nr:DNA repair protein RecO [Phaeovibrio sulfidiphilus]MBE1236270.1 DNA repair protein RecO [Phaeovibrio sulfidiphilus]